MWMLLPLIFFIHPGRTDFTSVFAVYQRSNIMEKGWNKFDTITAVAFFWFIVGTVFCIALFGVASVLVLYWRGFSEWTATITLRDILVNVGFYYTVVGCAIGVGASFSIYHESDNTEREWFVLVLIGVLVAVLLWIGKLFL